MPDLTLTLARWWPLLLWPLAVLGSWAALRGTRPEPARRLVRLLFGLRLTLWTALILLACGPALRWNRVERRPATLAVLLDNSASLPFLKGRLDHSDWLPRLEASHSGIKVRVFTYDSELKELTDDDSRVLSGAGVETDLDGALVAAERALQGDHWTGLLLVGDGNPTRGAWPVERVRRLGARVWCAGTGRLEPAADLVLRRLQGNTRARLGQAQPLSVEFEAQGLQGRPALLILREDGVERARRELLLGGDGARQTVELDWVPAVAGPRLLQAELTLPGGGEESGSNNLQSIQVRVDQARLPALILAGSPSPDLAFIRDILATREDLDLLFAMPERPGADLTALRTALDRTRLLVLADWPGRRSSTELRTAVAARAARTPLLWLDGAGATLDVLNPAMARSLGAWTQGGEESVRATQVHPLLGPEENLDELQELCANLPPLRPTRHAASLPSGSRTLLETRESARPLLIIQQQAELRRVWLPVADLWRWGVGSQLSLGENQRAREMVGGLVNWLLAAPGQGLLAVTPEREILPAGAPLAFSARLSEEDGRPRDGTAIELALQGPDSLTRRLLLEPRGGGAYEGSLAALPEGSWTWRAQARQGDRAVVADSGRVLAEARSPETLDAVRNNRLLSEMAALGGGALLDLDNADDRTRLASGAALDSLDRRPLLKRRDLLWEPTAAGWVLAGLLLLVAFEWIWRRLNGLL